MSHNSEGKEQELVFLYEEHVLKNTMKSIDKQRNKIWQQKHKEKSSIQTITRNMVSWLIAFKVKWFGY
jgi:hypothetical protein